MTPLSAEDCKNLSDIFRSKLKTLSSTIWQNRANAPQIRSWLGNFKGDVVDIETERTYALFLLTRLMYYGQREIRALLVSMYRDLFRYPLVAALRKQHSDTKSFALLNNLFEEQLRATRFVGFGAEGKSGPLISYEFRVANQIPEQCFTTLDAVLAGNTDDIPPGVKRYVFIDDICATGDQASEYSKDLVHPLRQKYGSAVELFYFVMFATTAGTHSLRQPSTDFDRVEAVHVLDDTFRAFGPQSRYFASPNGKLNLATAKSIASVYGSKLHSEPLGHGNCELLLAFHYNTPDNTLPIIWSKESAWIPIFARS